jgi:hypothetical protein
VDSDVSDGRFEEQLAETKRRREFVESLLEEMRRERADERAQGQELVRKAEDEQLILRANEATLREQLRVAKDARHLDRETKRAAKNVRVRPKRIQEFDQRVDRLNGAIDRLNRATDRLNGAIDRLKSCDNAANSDSDQDAVQGLDSLIRPCESRESTTKRFDQPNDETSSSLVIKLIKKAKDDLEQDLAQMEKDNAELREKGGRSLEAELKQQRELFNSIVDQLKVAEAASNVEQRKLIEDANVGARRRHRHHHHRGR